MGFSNKFYANYIQTTWGMFDKMEDFPDFLATMAGFSYGDTRIQGGKDFCTDLSDLHNLYLDKRQEMLSKRTEVKKKFNEVFTEYLNHVMRLREELRNDPETREELSLDGERDRSKAGFIDQSTSFYGMAKKPEIFSKIEGFGFTLEMLENGSKGVEEYRKLRSDYERLRGECQELVEKRHQAYVKLRDWRTPFITTCKVAYAGNLQSLERVGIFIRNRPKSRPKEEDNAQDTQDAQDAQDAQDTQNTETPTSTDAVDTESG